MATDALKRVTRWAPYVDDVRGRFGLEAVPIWAVLAVIHVESSGWARPEAHITGPDYAAEGLLQITPIAAEDAGVAVSDVDGVDGWRDGVRSLEVWGQLTSRYVGGDAPVWDYPLFWLAGSGTLQRARELRDAGNGYWPSWWQAAAEAPGAVTPRYVHQYAMRWLEAARAYWRWSQGAQDG